MITRRACPLVIAALLAGTGSIAVADPPRPAETIRLTIDYGDGVEKTFQRLPWRDGLTVLEALEKGDRHPRGISLRYRGSGSTAFVTEIDGLKNQGSGADSRNWLFEVNSKPADRGCGALRLEGGDQVIWKFRTSKP